MRIVAEVASTGGGRRIGRAIVALIGNLLSLAGLICFGLLAALALFIGSVGTGKGSVKESQLLAAAGLFIGGVVGVWLGVKLARGKRQLVLFLRRFGFRDSTRALSYAVATAMGRRWRLVTLDDAEVRPVGVGTGTRRVFAVLRWVLLAFVVFLVVPAVVSAFGKGDTMIGDLFQGTFESSQRSGKNAFEALLGAFFVTLMLGVVVFALLLFGFFFAAMAGLVTWASWSASRAVNRAERTRALAIRAASEIDPTVDRVVRQTRRIFAPRLVVLLTANPIWQQVVRKLADSSTAVLIDVSEPSENLLWELETLKGGGHVRWLLVGRRDRLEAIASGADSALAARLERVLGDDPILAYEGEDRSSMRRFARSLRAWLEQSKPRGQPR